MEQGFFTNLLSGYSAGVDRQREDAIRLAQQQFQQSQALFQREQFQEETTQRNKDYNLRLTTENNRAENQNTDNIANLFGQMQTGWKNGATGEQLQAMHKPQADALGIDFPNISSWGENPIIAEKRRHNQEMEASIFRRIKGSDQAKYVKMHADYVKMLMSASVPENDAKYQANLWLDAQIGGDSSSAPSEPTAQGMPNTPGQPQGMDMLNMLTGQQSSAGQPQGLTGGYDPNKVAPGIQVKNDYMGKIGTLADTRTAVNVQALQINQDKNHRASLMATVDMDLKKQQTNRIKTMTPIEATAERARIANTNSQIRERAAKMAKSERFEGLERQLLLARTDKVKQKEIVDGSLDKVRKAMEVAGQKLAQAKAQMRKLDGEAAALANAKPDTPEYASLQSYNNDLATLAVIAESQSQNFYHYQGMLIASGNWKAKPVPNPMDMTGSPPDMRTGVRLPTAAPNSQVRARQPLKKAGGKPAPGNTSSNLFEKYRAK